MAPRRYEISSSSPMAPQRSRRPSGSLPLPYDNVSNILPRRPYDSYIPPRAVPYRDEYPVANNYRPNIYRPGRSYYSRSPSPGRYVRPRSPELEALDRSTARKAPTWQDRRPPSPASIWRRDIMATPMFVPSETWKEAHVDRPGRPEIARSPPAERYSDRRARDSRNLSPGRLTRRDYLSPYYRGGDSYRPTSTYRDAIVRSDTYRPRYDDDLGTPHIRESVSATGLFTSHYDYNSDRRARSPGRFTGSISPHSRPRSPESHSRIYRETSHRSVSLPDSLRKMAEKSNRDDTGSQKRFRSRSSSRSSIASSRVSEPPRNINSRLPTSHLIVPADASPNSVIPVKADVVSKESEPLSRCSPGFPTKILPLGQPNDSGSTQVHTTQCLKSPSEIAKENVPTPSVTQVRTVASLKDTKLDVLAPRPNDQQQISMSPRQGLQLSGIPNAQRSQPASEINFSVRPCPSTTTMAQDNSEDDQLRDAALLPHKTSTPLLSSAEQPTDIPMEEDIGPAVNGTSGFSTPSSPLLVDEVLHGSSLDHRVEVELFSDINAGDVPEYIPPMADAKSMAEALRIVVMMRLRCDRQTREERINPVLLANLSITQTTPLRTSAHTHTSPDALLSEFTDGEHLDTRMQLFAQIRPSLLKRFAARQAALAIKTLRLREEYLTLHERWLAHCSRLDGASKISTSEEAIPPSGRTTRRSAATLGDAVRSDLEMEQIIASLGNDELTDPNQLSARNVATIPDMVSVGCGQVDYLYDDTNNLVHDPCEFYGPHTGIHDWTDEEKAIFTDKFAAFPKQFGVIADFLPNKTTAQCVDYYYLHKKTLIDFRKIVAQFAPTKRRRGTRRASKKKGNGLLADIRQHDDEVYRDMGSAANGLGSARRRTAMPPPVLERQRSASRRNTVHLEPTPTTTPTPEPETRPRRRRANPPSRASILAGLDEGEEDGTDTERKPAKKGRKNSRKVKSVAATPEEQPFITKFIDQSDFTARRKSTALHLQWSDVDKNIFLALLAQHGDDFKRIAASMPNKTTVQVSNFYKCNVVELDLERVAAGAPKRSPTPEPLRDAQKDIPQYTGSEVMLPVDMLLSDIAPPMSSRALSSGQTDNGVPAPHSPHGVTPMAHNDLAPTIEAGDYAPPAIDMSTFDSTPGSSWELFPSYFSTHINKHAVDTPGWLARTETS